MRLLIRVRAWGALPRRVTTSLHSPHAHVSPTTHHHATMRPRYRVTMRASDASGRFAFRIVHVARYRTTPPRHTNTLHLAYRVHTRDA